MCTTTPRMCRWVGIARAASLAEITGASGNPRAPSLASNQSGGGGTGWRACARFCPIGFLGKTRAPRRPRSAVSAPDSRRRSAVSGRSAWRSAPVRGRCGAGISPQLGSRPRPPGPRRCRPSSAWWSATGECAARSCRPGQGWLRGHGLGAPFQGAAACMGRCAWPRRARGRPPAQTHLMLPDPPNLAAACPPQWVEGQASPLGFQLVHPPLPSCCRELCLGP